MSLVFLVSLCLFAEDGTNRHFDPEYLSSIGNGIRDGGQDSTNKGREPVHKVVGIVVWVFIHFSHSKDIPRCCKHGIDGGTRRREQFDEGSNGKRRQCLFDPVMVRAKVEHPVQL